MGGFACQCPRCGIWKVSPRAMRDHVRASHPDLAVPRTIPSGPGIQLASITDREAEYARIGRERRAQRRAGRDGEPVVGPT